MITDDTRMDWQDKTESLWQLIAGKDIKINDIMWAEVIKRISSNKS